MHMFAKLSNEVRQMQNELGNNRVVQETLLAQRHDGSVEASSTSRLQAADHMPNGDGPAAQEADRDRLFGLSEEQEPPAVDEPTASPQGGASASRENLRRNIALANAISKQQGSQARCSAAAIQRPSRLRQTLINALGMVFDAFK